METKAYFLKDFIKIFRMQVYLLKHFEVFVNYLAASILGYTFGVHRYFESFSINKSHL